MLRCPLPAAPRTITSNLPKSPRRGWCRRPRRTGLPPIHSFISLPLDSYRLLVFGDQNPAVHPPSAHTTGCDWLKRMGRGEVGQGDANRIWDESRNREIWRSTAVLVSFTPQNQNFGAVNKLCGDASSDPITNQVAQRPLQKQAPRSALAYLATSGLRTASTGAATRRDGSAAAAAPASAAAGPERQVQTHRAQQCTLTGVVNSMQLRSSYILRTSARMQQNSSHQIYSKENRLQILS